MPTIIDSLVVELGLDPKKFTQGQKDALAAFKKTAEESRTRAKEIESHLSNVQQGVTSLTRRAAGYLALIAGGFGLKELIFYLVKTDAETGRFAKTIGTSSTTLAAWRGLAILSGGSAEAFTSSISGLVQQFQQFALTGDSSVLPYFRALGINISDADGKMRPFNDILLDIADSFSKMDPSRAAAFGKAFGFDDATISLLLRGRAAVEAMLETQKKIHAVTKENTDAAEELLERWGGLVLKVQGFGRLIYPYIGKVADFLNRDIKSFFGGGGAKAAEAAPASPTAPKGMSSKGEVEAYIRQAAIARGIDPDVALRVAKSEGLNAYVGDRGSSFGPYQLHYGGLASGGMAGKGLGDVFTKKTGLDARDPSTTRAQIDFALDWAKQNGWGPWHGWKGLPFQGIGVATGAGAGASSVDNRRSSTNTSETKIDRVIVNTQATDAAGIALAIKPAIERNSFAAQANYGPN